MSEEFRDKAQLEAHLHQALEHLPGTAYHRTTGLCVVKGLGSRESDLERDLPSIEAEYRGLGFDYYLAHRHELPPEIANEEGAVRDWLT